MTPDANKQTTGNASGANVFLDWNSAEPETFFDGSIRRANLVSFIHANYSQFLPLTYHQSTEM